MLKNIVIGKVAGVHGILADDDLPRSYVFCILYCPVCIPFCLHMPKSANASSRLLLSTFTFREPVMVLYDLLVSPNSRQ